MKLFLIAKAACFCLAIIIALGSLVAPAIAARRSASYQLVQKSPPAGALFGEVYVALGSPQVFFGVDPAAILPPAAGETTPRLDDDLLKAKGEYPTQLKSIQEVGSVGVGIAAGFALAGAVVHLLVIRKKCRLA